MKKYRKRTLGVYNMYTIIEALQFSGDNFKECRDWIGEKNYDNTLSYPNIITLEGIHKVSVGDYIIKGVQSTLDGYIFKDVRGEFYPCKPDIFAATYECEDRSPVK